MNRIHVRKTQDSPYTQFTCKPTNLPAYLRVHVYVLACVRMWKRVWLHVQPLLRVKNSHLSALQYARVGGRKQQTINSPACLCVCVYQYIPLWHTILKISFSLKLPKWHFNFFQILNHNLVGNYLTSRLPARSKFQFIFEKI